MSTNANARGSSRRSRSQRFGSLRARIAAARGRTAHATRRALDRTQRAARHTARLIRAAAAEALDALRHRLPRRIARGADAGNGHAASSAA